MSARSVGAAARPLASALLALGLSCVALTACAHKVERGTVAQQAPAKTNASGVTVEASLSGAPAVGQPVSVQLVFTGIDDAAGATVRVSADGARLSADPGVVSLAPGAERALRVALVPTQASGVFLNVFTTQGGATSALSVPIESASSRLNKSSALPKIDRERVLPAKVD